MRHGMTILAIIGILAGPTFSAEDPFDFSGPLPSVKGPRTAQYFSRKPAADDGQDSVRLERTGTPPLYRRTPRTEAGPQNPTSDRPESVSFAREMAREPQQQPKQNSQETLRRFDEFLKSRDVVSAAYEEQTTVERPSAIRQIQAESYEDLPSLGDLDDERAHTEPPKQSIRDLLIGEESGLPTMPKSASGDRLTQPIPTSVSADPVPANEPWASPDAPPAIPTETSPPKAMAPSLKVNGFGSLSAALEPAPIPIARPEAGDLSAPAISTEWELLDPLNVGQECRIKLTLTNDGEATADRVSLEVRLPETVQVIAADPVPVEERAFLGWKIAELSGGSTQVIHLTLRPNVAGPLDLETYARHTSASRKSYSISEPLLELAVSGPKEVHVGEPASQTLVVKNPGSGITTNVTIQALVPAGLEHASGERLQLEIGSLNPGEARSVRLVMGAVAGGDQILQVQATADAGLVQTASASVNVIAPSLRVGIAGPSLRYVGRDAEYTIRVLNDGAAAADFVKVEHQVPEGFDFVGADRDVQFDKPTRILYWNVGRLESAEALDLRLKLHPKQLGEFVQHVRATSDLGAQAESQVTTRVDGTASLVVKVADLDDPVEVGSETAYEVTITNEGTAAAKGVALTCEMPGSLSFLKAEGPSEHRLQSEMIGFRPVNVPAGESLMYRIFVKGAASGDQRFRCRLTSESLTQPLFTEELTKFYGE